MPARLADVAMKSPTLCGRCATCKRAGDVFKRFTEYVVNIDVKEGEYENTKDAVAWITNAYPKCPPIPVHSQFGVERG